MPRWDASSRACSSGERRRRVLVEGDIAEVGRLDNEAGFPIARTRRRPSRRYLSGTARSPASRDRGAMPSPDVAGLLQSSRGARFPKRVSARARRAAAAIEAAYRDHFAVTSRRRAVPDDTARRGADRRRRDGRVERRARSDLPDLHPQHQPRQRRRNPGNQPAGGDDGQAADRARARARAGDDARLWHRSGSRGDAAEDAPPRL